MYVYMYVCVCVYVCMIVYIGLTMYLCSMHLCRYIYVCMYVYVCIYLCMYICMYLCSPHVPINFFIDYLMGVGLYSQLNRHLVLGTISRLSYLTSQNKVNSLIKQLLYGPKFH